MWIVEKSMSTVKKYVSKQTRCSFTLRQSMLSLYFIVEEPVGSL